MIADRAEGTSKVQVEAVTLQQIFAEHSIERCNLLKMDCEGAEYETLAAVPADLWSRIERIHMEYHQGPPGWDGRKLAAYLCERGYRCDVVPRSRHPTMGNMFAVRATAGP